MKTAPEGSGVSMSARVQIAKDRTVREVNQDRCDNLESNNSPYKEIRPARSPCEQIDDRESRKHDQGRRNTSHVNLLGPETIVDFGKKKYLENPIEDPIYLRTGRYKYPN